MVVVMVKLIIALNLNLIYMGLNTNQFLLNYWYDDSVRYHEFYYDLFFNRFILQDDTYTLICNDHCNNEELLEMLGYGKWEEELSWF